MTLRDRFTILGGLAGLYLAYFIALTASPSAYERMSQ